MVRNQEGRSLTIGKLAQAGDVGVETVRFYQRRGLLDTPTRAHGVRRYGSEDLRRLRFIRQAQASGFTLRSEEHTSELQSLMRISYPVFCLKKKTETYKLITLL